MFPSHANDDAMTLFELVVMIGISLFEQNLSRTIVTSLASGNALVLVCGDASCFLLQKIEMGIVQILALKEFIRFT